MLGDIRLDPSATLLSISEVEAHDPAAAIVLVDETESLLGTFTIAMIVDDDCESIACDSTRDRTRDSFTRSGNEDCSAHRSHFLIQEQQIGLRLINFELSVRHELAT